MTVNNRYDQPDGVRARMISKQVKLPVQLGKRLRAEARRRRRTVSDVVAEALQRDLDSAAGDPPKPARNNGS